MQLSGIRNRMEVQEKKIPVFREIDIRRKGIDEMMLVNTKHGCKKIIALTNESLITDCRLPDRGEIIQIKITVFYSSQFILCLAQFLILHLQFNLMYLQLMQ